ncbi:MAG: hypothetical protein HC905_07120 [Bacteroidales bacterium]|nr:hypothetical protein [Bacteroidales bacterium]
MNERSTQYFSLIRHIYENSLGIRITGSAALDMLYVAAGYADSFIEFNLHPWDIAAGYILVKEAGGIASTFNGKEDIFAPEIVASGKLHPAMLQVIDNFMI